ncbi:hypothetical protein Tco_1553548, partial [Tanacetum coccineum]
MTDAQANQDTEDTHVTLTAEPPVVQQQSSSVSSDLVSNLIKGYPHWNLKCLSSGKQVNLLKLSLQFRAFLIRTSAFQMKNSSGCGVSYKLNIKSTYNKEFKQGNEDESPVREALNEDAIGIVQDLQLLIFLATPIDFSAFIMHRLKIDNLTQEVLTGPTYDLIKGTCKSVVVLEYHLEEVFKATNDRLDWNNPERKPYPHDLSKPLPLILNEHGHQVIPLDHFINNDLEYLKGGSITPRVLVSSMSDSEDSTVTYTEIPSPYEDLSDIGSPGAEGPIFQDPPSPDYVPGPEEPEQAPPSPIYVPFVPEPVYPEFLPEDDVLPVEEQPLPVAASPTTESPGYIPESDPEEDPEEDDEEDPANYPADRGDDRDDEEPSDDDDDDAEEEHLAPADPAAVAYSADQDPYLA